jgi:hypothetical protein
LQIHRLTAHPARPPSRVAGVRVVSQFLADGTLLLRWRIDGAQKVVLPAYSGSGRAEDLWQTTCFELFLDLGEGRYREFNFSPSGRWAAMDFTSYRVKSGDAELRKWPETTVERGEVIVTGAVRVPGEALAGAMRGALTTVVEEEGGVLSFWAAEHRKEQPDFHDASCFTTDFLSPGTP